MAVAPWLLGTIGSHGVEALLGAGSAGINLETSWTYLLSAGLTDEAFLAV